MRRATLVAFGGFHVGIALCINVGLFSYVCLAALLAFIPSDVLDAVTGVTGTWKGI